MKVVVSIKLNEHARQQYAYDCVIKVDTTATHLFVTYGGYTNPERTAFDFDAIDSVTITPS